MVLYRLERQTQKLWVLGDRGWSVLPVDAADMLHAENRPVLVGQDPLFRYIVVTKSWEVE